MSVMQLPYAWECSLLRATARVLALPYLASATALVFLHRCKQAHPVVSVTAQVRMAWHMRVRFPITAARDISMALQDLIAGCLYLAAKVEEVKQAM